MFRCLFGLIWNQWAGGASGFLLGSLYALYFSDQLYASQGSADISLLGNLVSAMLIGYISGALSKRSDNYRRMLFAGVTAGVMGSVLLLIVSQYSSIVGASFIRYFANFPSATIGRCSGALYSKGISCGAMKSQA